MDCLSTGDCASLIRFESGVSKLAAGVELGERAITDRQPPDREPRIDRNVKSFGQAVHAVALACISHLARR